MDRETSSSLNRRRCCWTVRDLGGSASFLATRLRFYVTKVLRKVHYMRRPSFVNPARGCQGCLLLRWAIPLPGEPAFADEARRSTRSYRFYLRTSFSPCSEAVRASIGPCRMRPWGEVRDSWPGGGWECMWLSLAQTVVGWFVLYGVHTDKLHRYRYLP